MDKSCNTLLVSSFPVRSTGNRSVNTVVASSSSRAMGASLATTHVIHYRSTSTPVASSIFCIVCDCVSVSR